MDTDINSDGKSSLQESSSDAEEQQDEEDDDASGAQAPSGSRTSRHVRWAD